MTSGNKTLIFIPTYNESENVEKLFSEIQALRIDADVLFLDDNSPDGTGAIIDQIDKKNNNVFVIHRTGKLGIGSAHKEGIAWAFMKKYDVLITMDCDFTHSPDYIIDFIKNSHHYDMIIGSRYLKNDSLKTWNLYRKSLTRLGHYCTTHLLNMPYDATGAFRLYYLKRIPQGVFNLIGSNSYSFFFESLFVLHLNKFTIHEFPISLPSRIYGDSKMTFSDIFISMKYLFLIFLKSKLFKHRYILRGSYLPIN